MEKYSRAGQATYDNVIRRMRIVFRRNLLPHCQHNPQYGRARLNNAGVSIQKVCTKLKGFVTDDPWFETRTVVGSAGK